MSGNEGAFGKMFKGTLGLAAGLVVASAAAGAVSAVGVLVKNKLEDRAERKRDEDMKRRAKENDDEATKAQG